VIVYKLIIHPNAALTYTYKKSAGYHHTLLRSGPTEISYGKPAHKYASLIGDSIALTFEGPVRVAIEQIKCLCSEEHAAKIHIIFILAKEITVFCCFSLTNLPKGLPIAEEDDEITGRPIKQYNPS